MNVYPCKQHSGNFYNLLSVDIFEAKVKPTYRKQLFHQRRCLKSIRFFSCTISILMEELFQSSVLRRSTGLYGRTLLLMHPVILNTCMSVCLLIEYPNHLLQIHYQFWKTSYTPGGIKVTHPSEKSLSYLDNEHPGHWIVRRPGLFEGPPRSPDLKSLDCVSLGTIVYCIHRTPMDC